ncbi:right-handed parallel beta-helix repeat-containing protein [Butyrivibrio sp. INlla16]|uniref:right-handed parallel beta-helix repeat-containing protein n=1 Tax=Butyrivibrio sp. INlla16 TaxID=1520807 RepID=UPI0008927AAA|nr:right-handed parallel beta-helix repeat-containing protein [Butyrivibrio sp. INlla16]SDB02495.1 Right handed beta helix region [Butyrivibrio sp. INlla16]
MQIYVSQSVVRSGDGTRNHPFRFIQEAADIARPGDVVIVAPGIYREFVHPKNSGTKDQPIVYCTTEPQGAVITGAEEIKEWEPFRGDVWKVSVPNNIFGNYNPFTTKVEGDWYFTDRENHTGEVYLNGKSMYEENSLEAVENPEVRRSSWDPEFSVYTWFSAQEMNDTVIFANFHGKDPNEENVEISVRRNCFMPLTDGINYITVSGFAMRQAATQWAPPTAYQDGLIGPHWAKGWIIEDCEIYESKCSGISLGKYLQSGNDNKWTKTYIKDGTQTERDAVCQAVNEGWDKEHIGSHIVRRCEIHDCGQTGIVGHLGGAFSTIEDNHIYRINTKHNIEGAEIGGIKMHAAIDTIFRRNHIHHCTRGIWLDWQAQGTRVTQNFFHDNTPPEGCEIKSGLSLGEDLFVEVSHGPTLIDHNLMLSDISCRLSTQGIALVHNLINGSFTFVGEGCDNGGLKFQSCRYTPYHVPHSTKIAGFMTILHGDARFYNNIFVQKEIRQDLRDYVHQAGFESLTLYNFICGTKPYDGYPTKEQYFASLKPMSGDFAKPGSNDKYYDHLPVYTGGNAFFNGAQPCDSEHSPYIEKNHTVKIIVSEEDGHFRLHTNLYEYLPRSMTRMVSTKVMGQAFEPEQFFENPDGTEIIFDTDYFGRKRSIHPLCGPFEEGAADRFTVAYPTMGGRAIYYHDKHRLEGRARKRISQKDLEDMEPEQRPFGEFENGPEGEASWEAMEKEDEVARIQADITMTGCENVTFPYNGTLFQVQDIFVRGNTAWLRDLKTQRLVEVDCEYGIYSEKKKWSVSSLQSVDAGSDANMSGLVQTVGTLLCVLSKSMAHDPADACKTISERVNKALEPRITMRLTPKYLKFIQEKKFISLEDVIYRVKTSPIEPVTETVENL